MNNRTYSLLCGLLLLSTSLFAQMTFYNSHYFQPGLTVTYQPVPDSLVTFEENGDSLTWNYAELFALGDSYSRSIQASENSLFGGRYQEANVVIVGENNDQVYLRVQHDRTDFIAFVPPDTSYFVYNYQPWSISIHPMRLGDTVRTPAARIIQLPDRNIYREGQVLTTAIASGRLILPNRTYEQVLKIKEVQTFTNSARTTFYQATTYHWLSNDCNFPLLSCNEILNRSSTGEEQVTRFAQYLLDEQGTQVNMKVMELQSGIFAPH